MMDNPRIISMVGREIAGYHQNLHKGFDDLGIENHFFFERTHPFYNYEGNKTTFEKWVVALNDLIFVQGRSFPKRLVFFALIYPMAYVLKIILFGVFLKKYDVFIYSTNYSFLGLFIDRAILKLFGKVSIDVVMGADARPPYINGKYDDYNIAFIRVLTKIKKWRIGLKEKLTTHCITHPTLSQFYSKKYVPHLYVGFPFYMAVKPQETYKNREKILILHAPSAPKIKGTDIVREVIADLQNDYDFDYEEIIGMPHERVLEKLDECHFVVNELFSDTPMSGLDTEAAWFGKPSIIAGYNLQMVEDSVQGYEAAPTYRIYPSKDDLKKAVIYLLEDKKYREDLGLKAQKFMRKNWSSKIVAEKYLDILNGNIPNDIMRSPYDDFDIYGCGIRNEPRRQVINKMIDKYGDSSLCIDDKPKLKQMILDDAKNG